MATSSGGIGATASRMRARASSTDRAAMALALPLVRGTVGAGAAAGLFDETDTVERHGFVGGFEHVVDGEAGDGDGGQRLHLDAGLAGHLDLGGDANAGWIARGLELDGRLG